MTAWPPPVRAMRTPRARLGGRQPARRSRCSLVFSLRARRTDGRAAVPRLDLDEQRARSAWPVPLRRARSSSLRDERARGCQDALQRAWSEAYSGTAAGARDHLAEPPAARGVRDPRSALGRRTFSGPAHGLPAHWSSCSRTASCTGCRRSTRSSAAPVPAIPVPGSSCSARGAAPRRSSTTPASSARSSSVPRPRASPRTCTPSKSAGSVPTAAPPDRPAPSPGAADRRGRSIPRQPADARQSGPAASQSCATWERGMLGTGQALPEPSRKI